MIDANDQKIIEKYKTLPQRLKGVLWSDETIDTIFNAGKAQKLTVAQMEEIADLVGSIILGVTKKEDFNFEIQRNLNISKEIADKISVLINEKVFAPVQNELSAVLSTIPTIPTAPSIQASVPPMPSPPPKETATKNSPAIAEQKKEPADSFEEREAQLLSVFAKKVPEPLRYQGKDPYREPIDENEPPAFRLAPTKPPASRTIQSEARKDEEKTETSRGEIKSNSLNTDKALRPISWEDISLTNNKEPAEPPEIKSALERALNSGSVIAPRPPKPKEWESEAPKNINTPPPQPPKQQPPTNKDPYRELIE